MHRWGGNTAFPSVITVFSAPNYCNEYHNKGAVILIENDKMNIKQYKDVPTPFHLPNDMDLFKWSVPFLMEKVSDMLFHLTAKNSKIEPIKDEEIEKVDLHNLLQEQAVQEQPKPYFADASDAKKHKMQVLRKKILVFARMNRIFNTIK